MGKSSAPTIGWWHKLTLYTGECHGPVDALRAVEWGGETAWEGNHVGSGDIFIDKPELFGGEKKEGGIKGTLSVRMGEPTQLPHPLMQALVPGPWPAARGLVTTVYDGDVGALSPYVKSCSKLWSRWHAGWTAGEWQPTLAKIGEGMNPAHMLYQTMTEPDWGYGGAAVDVIDEANLLPVAQALFNEGLGLCLKWNTSTAIGAWLNTICDHIGAIWAVRDEKVVVTLIRPDYDVGTLPLLDESNIKQLEEWTQPLVDGSVNEVTVVGLDALTGKEIARTYQNLANIQAQGRVVAEKLQLPGLWNVDLVARAAARQCHAKSMLPARVKVAVKASAGPFIRGEVRALSWARKGVVRMPVRVMEVDEGTLTDSIVHLTLIQDVVGMEQTSYIAPVSTVWTKPDTTPVALNPETVYEATYRDLVGLLRPADLAQVAPESGYVVALGARPAVPAYNFTVVTRTAAAPFVEDGAGDFSPNGVLTAGIGPADTLITLNSHQSLTLVTVGEECVIGGVEHCRVTSINAGTGEVGIARGCVDTVPQAHAIGALVWFPDTYHGYSRTEYLDGETVDAKLLTRTSSGTLAEAAATTRSVVMDQRQYRPYPPADLQINGQRYPASVTGEVTVAWVPRDRLLQADQLVDTLQAGIGPEAGTEHRVRFYSGAVLKRTVNNATAPYTYLEADELADGGPFNPLRVVVDSVRGGLESRYGLDWTVGRIFPLAITTAFVPPAVINEPYSFQMQAEGGVPPLAWSILSGTLPAGLSMDGNGLITGTATSLAGPVNITYQAEGPPGNTDTAVIPISVVTARTLFDEIMADAPVLYFRHAEASGAVMTNEVGDDGAYVSSPPLGQAAIYTGGPTCMLASLNRYGEFSGPFPDTMPALTLQQVVSFNAVTGFRGLISADSTGPRIWQWRLNGTSLEFVKIVGGVQTIAQASVVTVSTPTLLTVTISATGALKFYQDGVEIHSAALSPADYAMTGALMEIGFMGGGGGASADAYMSESVVYDKVLSAARVLAHAQAAGFA